MSNVTSDEREQWLKEIRITRGTGVLPWSHLSNPQHRFEVARDTIDFLLSLIDSEAAGDGTDYKKLARELALIVDVGTSDDPGTALSKLRKIQYDAATSMRDLCVGEVKTASYYHDSRCLCVTAIHGPCDCGAKARFEKLVSKLQSLILDQMEQKRK